MDRNGNGFSYFINEDENIFFGLDDSLRSAEIEQNIPENGWNNCQISNNNWNHGIYQGKPKYQQFAIKSVRLSSYTNLPLYVRQTKESLAEAGFFYSGKDDLVYCFFCGQGLKSWEPTDEPWAEHAKWAPKCVYLNNVKGSEYINSIHNSQNRKCPAASNSQSSSARERSSGKDTDNNNINDTPTGMLMNTIAAESLVTCGYDRASIRNAIKIFIKNNGNKEFKATDIVSIIFELQDGSLGTKENLAVNSTPKTSENSKSSQRNILEEINEKSDSRSLLEENKQLKDQTCCKICLEEIVSIVFLPCGHLCSCAECAPALNICPICRTVVQGTVKTFLA